MVSLRGWLRGIVSLLKSGRLSRGPLIARQIGRFNSEEIPCESGGETFLSCAPALLAVSLTYGYLARGPFFRDMYRFSASNFLLVCTALSAAVADQRLRTLWLEHVLEVKSFACREPKRVSIAATDLAAEVDDGYQNSALVWQPACSALYRCAGAGCCAGAPRRACAAADADYVNLVFYVKNALEPHLPAFFRELSVLNHTACVCRDIVDLPKR